MKMIIDVAEIKKAVNDNQLVFFTKELCSRTYIFCKDTQTEECACVGEIKEESEAEE
jgi:hypothetical protein